MYNAAPPCTDFVLGGEGDDGEMSQLVELGGAEGRQLVLVRCGQTYVTACSVTL